MIPSLYIEKTTRFVSVSPGGSISSSKSTAKLIRWCYATGVDALRTVLSMLESTLRILERSCHIFEASRRDTNVVTKSQKS